MLSKDQMVNTAHVNVYSHDQYQIIGSSWCRIDQTDMQNEVTSVLLFIQQSKVQLSTLKLVFDLLIPKRVQLSNPQPSHPQAGYP